MGPPEGVEAAITFEIKSSRRTRRYAGMAGVSHAHEAQLKRLMPYE